MGKKLRPYQEAAIKSIFSYIASKAGNPLVVAPVSAGKSLLIVKTMKQAQEMYPRTRIVVLTHVKELLQQIGEELIGEYPNADFGFYCSSLGEKRLHNDITLASIQSVHDKISAFNRVPEIIIIDECHLVSHKETTLYRKFIDSVLALNPNCRVIGFTGTPFRADSGRLDDGDGKLFDGVAYEISMAYMIEEGYWTRPVVPRVETHMNVDGVKTRGGDYIESQLAAAVDVDETTQSCVSEMVKLAADRKRWLVFTASVQHCEHFRDALRAAGISAEMVIGDMPATERDDIISRFRRGDFKALVNVAVLTTGFNVPEIDMIAFCRPTKSKVLYIQTLGRGVRTVYAKGYDLESRDGRLAAIENGIKPNLLVLDFGGVVSNLGPVDLINVERRKMGTGTSEQKEKGEAIFKICPACGENCAPAQSYCYSCSYCFVDIKRTAEKNAPILSSDIEPQKVSVMAVSYRRHQSKNSDGTLKKPTLRVDYATMSGKYSEWICFEHPSGSYPRDLAVHWHNNRLPSVVAPQTVEEALTLQYPAPSSITIKPEGKYDKIVSYDFSAPDKDELDLSGFEEIEVF